MKYTIGRGRSVEERTLFNFTARQSVISGMMLCLLTVSMLVFDGWRSMLMIGLTVVAELVLLLWMVERRDGEPVLFYIRDALRYTFVARQSYYDTDGN